MPLFSPPLGRPAWALVALALAGCGALPAVGPDYQPPTAELPARWSSGSDAAPADAARWWQRFGDTDLDRLVDRALAGNLDLKLAAARLRQARASRAQTAGAYFPTITGGLSASRSHTASAIQSSSGRTLYDAGFDASWEIDLFGGTRRAVEAADADLDARRADAEAARVSLVAEVVQNYIDLRSDQQRLAIARANLATQDETLQIVEWRERAGLANRSEVEQARTNREQTRAGMPDLETAIAGALNRLDVLLGQPPGTLRDELAAARPLPAVGPEVAAGIPADVLRRRPDLVAAERTLAAETARVGQVMAQRFPALSLSAAFGWQAYRLGDLGAAGSGTRSLAGSLAATLFDGGRLRAAVAVQDAVQEQALISYRNSVLTAHEEVENALADHAAARERLAARQAAADAAREAARLSRRLYESGLADFQKVLDTERTRLSAEDNLALAEASRLSSVVKLYKALGGGWTSKENPS